MEKTIFVIEGSTGEYLDHWEWIICAFENEDKAKEMVNKCTEEYRRIAQELDDAQKMYCDYETLVSEGLIKPHQYDPMFDIDYMGTNYTFYKTKLITD